MTERGKVTVELFEPEVPVIVRVLAPIAAVELAERMRVEYCVTGLGVNEAVTPLGRPEIDKLTLPVKPYSGFTKTNV